ncbi:nuclear factor NF-kappa-B p110 subunit-like isoform X2 [Eurosta solidaginis]|uniref:nuclear factor NF-kappa-B p110 subunit-like isoform X2 n=1 Tax=Eurosta solidaginis TaxID=178769 RepID=UPI003530B233
MLRHITKCDSGMPSAMVSLPQQQYGGILSSSQMLSNLSSATASSRKISLNHGNYLAELRILEQPVEKFRFRYKSEMHGTHGSLNGANSKRTPKTFPEVELYNYKGKAEIRCSLFQTNLESPHSHQLVVRKDETDICDPHRLTVSPERGYVAQFQNMGIIHTAKKFIFDELLRKKQDRLKFDLGRNELSTKEVQELHKETEKESKEMNLNQVRLCFEAFKENDDNTYSRIAAPVFSNPINNRKSAQTGELRICRLSIATGSVSGGDDLILLVEKVSKKNIKVRFYQFNEDEDLVWEAFGKFRESDVHHQYAIVCQTPPYKDKDIDKPVDVYIELMRPSDDERSYPPVTFRYKPRDIVVSRKRRRTCSSATSSSGSGSSLNSFELPKPVQEQTADMKMETEQEQIQLANMAGVHGMNQPTISEEYDKNLQISKLMGSDVFRECLNINSEELEKICPNYSVENISDIYNELSSNGTLVEDGSSSTSSRQTANDIRKIYIKSILGTSVDMQPNSYLQRIFKIFDDTRTAKNFSAVQIARAAKQVEDILTEHSEKNVLKESLIHEIIASDNAKLVIKTCHVLNYFKLNHLLNKILNQHNESALHTACLHDRVNYIRPLLGLGCDPNLQNSNGDTALHIAVKEVHQKCIESFVKRDVPLDLTISNDEGLTCLHLAIRQKNYDIAKLLLQHDRQAALVPNTKERNNALHMAVLQSNFELVKLILDNISAHNVDEVMRACNAAGHTAIELAKELNSKVANQICTYILSLSSNIDYDNRLIIKEEEMSSSSTEEDEDTTEFNTSTIKDIIDQLEIKEEFDVGESYKKEKDPPRTLNELLCDENKYRILVNALTTEEKWRKLAVPCKMQHLLCLWNNAEDMIEYMRKNIEYDVFVSALELVDKQTLKMLQHT